MRNWSWRTLPGEAKQCLISLWGGLQETSRLLTSGDYPRLFRLSRDASRVGTSTREWAECNLTPTHPFTRSPASLLLCSSCLRGSISNRILVGASLRSEQHESSWQLHRKSGSTRSFLSRFWTSRFTSPICHSIIQTAVASLVWFPYIYTYVVCSV